MISASELRERARTSLSGNWGIAILSFLILIVINSALSFTYVGGLIVAGPLFLGLTIIYFDISRKNKPKIESLFSGFSNFVNAFLLYVLQYIFIILWSLLFIIPGIVKALSYSMAFFIMADNPEISGNDALKESMRMMDGNKWRLFCLNFSFIGWIILSCITLGIGFIFLLPYMLSANVEFYEDLKKDSIPQIENPQIINPS